ncbi:MAG: glutamate formimidoyltransferase [Bacillota bacterium]
MNLLVAVVPNFSEGRRTDVIESIVAPYHDHPLVRLLDVASDADHNRVVVTAVGPPEVMAEATFDCIRRAAGLINMAEHKGEHPRMGATDVVPFIPVKGVSMADCVALAKGLGRRVGEELGIPVYLYEAAASRPERQDLAYIRKGQYEGFKTKIQLPDWVPDFGPQTLHPTAGATVIGARMPLVAFNVNLGTADIAIADRISKAVRHSSGGLRFCKAVGVALKAKGIVQVSMNLTDYTRTALHRAFELVRVEAERYGVPVVGSEIIGLTPMAALIDAAAHHLRLEGFRLDQVLEQHLADEA